jgi:hypothetical protein
VKAKRALLSSLPSLIQAEHIKIMCSAKDEDEIYFIALLCKSSVDQEEN